MRFNSKMYEITTSTDIISSISKEIFRKVRNSLLVNGFSGVSSGQNAIIVTNETVDRTNSSSLTFTMFVNLIATIHSNMDNTDIISHLVSVLA